ncbi:MAG: TetR/AcrR family transcriptional regulator [Novosphingobium sp.]|jgi:AcrR family transcriptional regulator|nr:TetR/AcrR family transcriptional regulator [Novosphingobium sp.]
MAAGSRKADRTAEPHGAAAGATIGTTGRVSHNLNGQRLGRKGRGTRDRILTACAALLADPADAPISMSAIARRASLGMTSLYNYFGDLTEVLLAVLDPVMATAEESYLAILRERWPDAELRHRCHAFINAYHGFWARHSRLLHLRNAMADSGDERMLIHRVRSTEPLIGLFVAQMDGEGDDMQAPLRGVATVLMTGIERTVTVATDSILIGLFGEARRRDPDYYLQPAARLMELVIADTRTAG